jgi:hypothetical protein
MVICFAGDAAGVVDAGIVVGPGPAVVDGGAAVVVAGDEEQPPRTSAEIIRIVARISRYFFNASSLKFSIFF